MNKKKAPYRRPDLLPQLRVLPDIGDLCGLQDLDGEVFTVVVLDIKFCKTKKGKLTKKLQGITILTGNIISDVMLHQLKRLD
jgi:hypothetical protein